MENLTKKQKIIAGAIIGIVIIIIGIYGYNMLQEDNWEQDATLSDENLQNEMANLEEQNEITEGIENREEEANAENETKLHEGLEGKIVIHMTGAVQKTGILVLPEGARIADAIDASRRDYRKG